MKWFQRQPGNLASFVPRYPLDRRVAILRWHEFAVRHAIDCQPDDFQEFLQWLPQAYRSQLISRARTLPRHSGDRRMIARNLLTVRLYRNEVAKLLA